VRVLRRILAAGAALAAAAAQAQQPAPATAYEQAVAARLRGEAATAVRLLAPIVAADPAHSDAQVQLGYALLALGRLDEATRAFEAALAVAPGYADARLGLARIQQRRGDVPAALRALEPLDPSNPEVRTLRAQLGRTEAAHDWAVDIDGSYSFLDRPQPDWAEASLQLRRRLDPATTLSGRVEAARRFDLTDVYGEIGVDRAVGRRGRAYVTLGGTPDADFRPRWQIGAGGSWRVIEGASPTVITLDGRHAEFVTGEVQTLSPGLEQYLFGGRAWLTARWINLFDASGDHQSGYLLRGDVLATDRLRLFAGSSDAPDTSEGVVTDTRSYFGGISYGISARSTARVTVAVEDRETGSDRTQVGLGLGIRF
jgi:YaiO family outer membrane protein